MMHEQGMHNQGMQSQGMYGHQGMQGSVMQGAGMQGSGMQGVYQSGPQQPGALGHGIGDQTAMQNIGRLGNYREGNLSNGLFWGTRLMGLPEWHIW